MTCSFNLSEVRSLLDWGATLSPSVVKILHCFLRNCQLAFLTAETGLGITALLDVSDVARGCPDRLSILTYVSQFYHTFQSDSPDSGISSPSEEQDRTRYEMAESGVEMVDIDLYQERRSERRSAQSHQHQEEQVGVSIAANTERKSFQERISRQSSKSQ